MTTPDLLPCPFCGGKATTWIGRDYFYVGCDECEAESATFMTKEKAIAAWNTRAALRWIPVTERLPEDEEHVIVLEKDGKRDLAWHNSLDYWQNWYRIIREVTHWMPLPALPKEAPDDPNP